MKLFPAICPQCSASLDFKETDEYVICNHCQTKIFVVKDNNKSPDFDRLLNLGRISEESGNYSEAFQYYSEALLLNPQSPEAWRGKGYAAGMQSTLASNRLKETINCYTQSLSVADENSVDALKMEYALSVFKLARDYFDLSLEHTLKFISVRDAQFEHADRCRSIIELCEYALSLDSELSTIKTFINDISSRCEKITFLDAPTKSFFSGMRNKYAVYGKQVSASTGSSDLFSGPGLLAVVVVFGALALNYYIASSLIGVNNPVEAFFTAILLFLPEAFVFGWGTLGILNLLGAKKK